MAFVRDQLCIRCGQTTTHINGQCAVCSKIDRENEIRNWESMSIERKLTDIRNRLEKLEQGQIKY